MAYAFSPNNMMKMPRLSTSPQELVRQQRLEPQYHGDPQQQQQQQQLQQESSSHSAGPSTKSAASPTSPDIIQVELRASERHGCELIE